MRFRTLIIALPLALSASQAVAARYDNVVIEGSGGFSPGLGVYPGWQSFWLDGTATVVGTSGVAAIYPCSFSGQVTGNIAGGAGPMAGACGPAAFPDCAIVFAGTTFSFVCSTASPLRAASFSCEWQPHQVPPTTAISFVCVGAWALE